MQHEKASANARNKNKGKKKSQLKKDLVLAYCKRLVTLKVEAFKQATTTAFTILVTLFKDKKLKEVIDTICKGKLSKAITLFPALQEVNKSLVYLAYSVSTDEVLKEVLPTVQRNLLTPYLLSKSLASLKKDKNLRKAVSACESTPEIKEIPKIKKLLANKTKVEKKTEPIKPLVNLQEEIEKLAKDKEFQFKVLMEMKVSDFNQILSDKKISREDRSFLKNTILEVSKLWVNTKIS